jgi:hypothetical protein
MDISEIANPHGFELGTINQIITHIKKSIVHQVEQSWNDGEVQITITENLESYNRTKNWQI